MSATAASSATAATSPVEARTSSATDTVAGAEKQGWGFTLLGIIRVMLGFTFLWAFLDKTIGLGFATPAERAWVNGGSPTTGFLGGSIEGGNPFAGVWEFFLSINPLTDVLFMVGLLGIGLALMLGIGTRVAAVSGCAMYLLMFLAAFPMTTNPLFDDHLILGLLLLAMAGLAAGDHVGFGRTWSKLVKGNRFLI